MNRSSIVPPAAGFTAVCRCKVVLPIRIIGLTTNACLSLNNGHALLGSRTVAQCQEGDLASGQNRPYRRGPAISAPPYETKSATNYRGLAAQTSLCRCCLAAYV